MPQQTLNPKPFSVKLRLVVAEFQREEDSKKQSPTEDPRDQPKDFPTLSWTAHRLMAMAIAISSQASLIRPREISKNEFRN